jgi:hypothetical protein
MIFFAAELQNLRNRLLLRNYLGFLVTIMNLKKGQIIKNNQY